ncbi:hypothetical protein ACFX2F_030936 [Malus domestica]
MCQALVTPHFAEKADEMTFANKDSKILLDRDLDRQPVSPVAVLFIQTEDLHGRLIIRQQCYLSKLKMFAGCLHSAVSLN